MPQKIKPTGRQKSMFFIHLVVFAIVTALTWWLLYKDAEGWVYPWPAWTTAAWGLSLLGHWCAVYTSYEDPGHDEFRRQVNNG